MSARVLFIGLDAAEPRLIEAGIGNGTLPALKGLAAVGGSGRLANCMPTLPGAVWPEISSGVSCGRLPRFFHPRQLFTGDAAPRSLTADDVREDPTFWNLASAQGRRVAVVDIPHSPLAAGFAGAQVVEYGLHDSHFGSASMPGSLIYELRARHGDYPVRSCDHAGGNRAANLKLLDDLVLAIERKTRVVLDVLNRDDWDLFACAFSEAHCAGHWFWHYQDASHWAHEPDAPARLREAVASIYARLDDAVGRIMAAAGAETTIVLSSHGMAPYVAGYQLLPEVLARLGMSSAPAGSRSVLRELQKTAKHWVPRRYWEPIGRLLVENAAMRAVMRPLQRSSGAMFFPLESPETRAVYLPNNTIGAIRLNLRGREPLGRVEPGAEEAALIEELRTELLALVEPVSRVPIVEDVSTAAELFGPDHHADVPDLVVRFRQNLGLLEACESPRVGRVRVPVGSRWGRRTGDHSPHSAVWVDGPDYARGKLAAGSLIDIAPTILEALGCDLPPFLEGRPLRFSLSRPARASSQNHRG